MMLFFDESFSSPLAYTSQPYSEAMNVRPSVAYAPWATSSREQTGDIITFTQFEEVNSPSETNSPYGEKIDNMKLVTMQRAATNLMKIK